MFEIVSHRRTAIPSGTDKNMMDHVLVDEEGLSTRLVPLLNLNPQVQWYSQLSHGCRTYFIGFSTKACVNGMYILVKCSLLQHASCFDSLPAQSLQAPSN